MDKTFDHHIHIGRFRDIFYDYKYVFDFLGQNGVKKAICSHLTPCFTNYNCGISFYDLMLENVKNAKEYADKINLKVQFYYWVDPVIITGGMPLSDVLKTKLFEGFKLHPRFSNLTEEIINKVFETANDNNLPILIHTGVDSIDEPMQFEKYFKKYNKVKVQLAHCKEPKSIIELFSKYSQLIGDTAFCSQDSLASICDAGFESRMVFGSDFPINEYFKNIR